MKNYKAHPRPENKSLHVLFTGLVSSNVLTGGDQLFLDIAPRLPKDLRIIIITPEFAKDHWNDIDQSNIEFRLIPKSIFDLKSNPLLIFLSYMMRAWRVYWILRREDIQTIYSCSDIAYADIWPAFLITKKRTHIKWLTRVYHVLLPPNSRQGSYLVNLIAFYLQKLSFNMMKRGSSTTFALNHKLYKEILHLGFEKDRVRILGAGIDFQIINKFKPVKKYPYDIVVLGRIAPVKGIFDAVKIWKKVHEAVPDAQLAWIGGGGENHRRKMVSQIKEASLEQSFHLMGFVDQNEKYSILKSAKIFLCPDHENGWGLAVCEAMSAGLPVVSYDLDIFGGVYKKGFRSVPLYSTDRFADEIISLLKSESTRKRLATDALNQASEFDHQKVINDLVPYL